MGNNNRRGFTLVELLAVIVILGIVIGISLPLVRRIQEDNKNKKFQVYADGVLYSAKLYMNSYEEDLFGDVGSGCSIVRYDSLKERNLLKDIALDDITCGGVGEDGKSETFVRIVKVNDHYGYSKYVKCRDKNTHEIVYEEGKEEDTTCTNEAGSLINISVNPEKSTVYKKEVSIDVTLSSATGIYPNNIGIEYAFSSKENEENIIGTWSPLRYTIPSEEEQYEEIEAGHIIEVTSKIQTPREYTGKVYLLIKVLNLRDLSNNSGKENDDIEIYGTYNLDNTKPTATITATNDMANSQTVTFNFADNIELSRYYFGTNNPKTSTDITYETISGKNVQITKSVTKGGTLYLRVYDKAGNYYDESRVFYKTVLKANEGTAVDPNNIITLSGNSFILPTTTRENYTFKGWYKGGTRIGGAGESYTPKSNATLTAQWTSNNTTNDYTVILDQQGGIGGTESVIVTYGNTMPTIDIPNREYTVTFDYVIRSFPGLETVEKKVSYTFDGYYTSIDGQGIKYYDANGESVRNWDINSDSTLYAKWIEGSVELLGLTTEFTNYLTILLGPAGSTQMDSIISSRFTGWHTEDKTEVGGVGEFYTPKEDIILYAGWIFKEGGGGNSEIECEIKQDDAYVCGSTCTNQDSWGQVSCYDNYCPGESYEVCY